MRRYIFEAPESVRTYKVNYIAAAKKINDPNPFILYLGSWVSTKGNNLICGLNLNYLTSVQKGLLEVWLPYIFEGTDTQTRVRNVRYYVPEIFNLAYRTWDQSSISNVVRGEIILTPDAERVEAERKWKPAFAREYEAPELPPEPVAEPEAPPTEPEEPEEPEVPEAPPEALPAPAPSPVIKPAAPPPPEPSKPRLSIITNPKPTPQDTAPKPPPAPGFAAKTAAQRRRDSINDRIESGNTPTGPIKPAKATEAKKPVPPATPIRPPTSAQRAARKAVDDANEGNLPGTDNIGPQARGLIDPKKP